MHFLINFHIKNIIQIILVSNFYKKDTIMQVAPKSNITTKSAVRLRNEPSSNILQYLYVNIMLKKKLNPNVPKNRNEVIIL